MQKNKPTPIALFAFNRPNQLKEVLKCLKANKPPILYVFADGPRNKDEEESTDAVRALVDKIRWTKVIKVYQPKNIGLRPSFEKGLSKIFETYEDVIVIEDDICVSPNFYQFMTNCLKKYSENPKIAGITGLRYPFSRDNLMQDPSDIFLSPRFSSWGWATWKHVWNELSFNSASLNKSVKSQRANYSSGGNDLPYAIDAVSEGKLEEAWDVYFFMNMVKNGTNFIWPKYNLVRNNGLTQGFHASDAAEPSWKLIWENPKKKSWLLPSTPKLNDSIVEDFLNFFLPENLHATVQKQVTNQTTKRLHERLATMKPIRSTMNTIAHKAGYHISKQGAPTPEVTEVVKETIQPEEVTMPAIDPTDYSTTDDPQEVPCQKVAYYHALKNYITPSSSVLDVGSGLGYGMAIMSVVAKEVQGIDVDGKAVKHAKAEYVGNNPKIKNVQKYDGYKTPFADNTFDVVTCIDVLEHVEDYHKFLKELLRISKKHVLISTPNQRPEFTKEDGSPKNYWHLREWKPKELDAILSEHTGTAATEWFYVDGPFDGPFKVMQKPGKDTLVLMPVLTKKKK